MLSDGELLRRYVEDGSQPAFTELVQRHINMVYIAALRQVGRNAHTADDVTQSVFTDLARKAGSLRNRPNLAGWLYTGTRFAAADAVRAERRRRAHEQETPPMTESNSPPPVPADRLEPLLDEVMALLPAQDRDVILLHFFEGRSFPEVGSILSLSADAARMRANRALERLRSGFAKRGIASSAIALAASLSTQSALASMAPTALAVASRAVSRAAVSGAGGSAVGRLFQGAKTHSFLSWAGTAILIGVAGVAISEYHRASLAGAADAAVSVDEVNATVDSSTVGASALLVGQAPVPSPGPVVLPLPASGAASASSDFEALSEPEKHILKALWNRQENLPAVPGRRPGLHVGRLAPNFADFAAGRDRLQAEGLIRMGPKPETVFLTNRGVAFCRVNSAAIDGYPRFYNLGVAQ